MDSIESFSDEFNSQSPNNKILQDLLSDGIGRESLNSMNRRQKLSYLGEDYGSYLQQF